MRTSFQGRDCQSPSNSTSNADEDGVFAAWRGAGHDRSRQVVERDLIAFTQQHRSFDDVNQLADVAGPRITDERLHGLFGKRCNVTAEPYAKVVQITFGEFRNVLGMLTQRGYVERHDAQPVVQIAAETARLDLFAAGRGWWPP